MSDEEDRAQRRKDYPNHYFARVVGFGMSAIVAIPKPDKPLEPGGFFDCPELFHGATITLNWKANDSDREHFPQTGDATYKSPR